MLTKSWSLCEAHNALGVDQRQQRHQTCHRSSKCWSQTLRCFELWNRTFGQHHLDHTRASANRFCQVCSKSFRVLKVQLLSLAKHTPQASTLVKLEIGRQKNASLQKSLRDTKMSYQTIPNEADVESVIKILRFVAEVSTIFEFQHVLALLQPAPRPSTSVTSVANQKMQSLRTGSTTSVAALVHLLP